MTKTEIGVTVVGLCTANWKIDTAKKACEPEQVVAKPTYITRYPLKEDSIDIYILNDGQIDCGDKINSFAGQVVAQGAFLPLRRMGSTEGHR